MAIALRVVLPDRRVTYTVLSRDGLPVDPVEQYLEHLRAELAPTNTVRSYVRGLAAWWTVLEHTSTPWDDFPGKLFGDFLNYLRSGDLPGTSRISPPERWLAEASVQARATAVLSFYRYQAAARQVTKPYDALFSARVQRRRARYVPELEGIATPDQPPARPIYRMRPPHRGPTPVLLPEQIRVILDGCARQQPDGAWTGNLRNRLLFATLIETGVRLGEALALRHRDWHIGRGQTPFIEVVPHEEHPHGQVTKGRRGRRIYIGDDLERLYSEFVWQLVDAGAAEAQDPLDGWWVFVNLDREPWLAPIRPENVYDRVKALRRRPEVPPDWTPHWFRHTHATALLLAGVPPHVVMRRLGHQDIQTTLGTYGWVTEDAELRALANWQHFTSAWKGIHA
jgi:site-specific recombinase XerD